MASLLHQTVEKINKQVGVKKKAVRLDRLILLKEVLIRVMEVRENEREKKEKKSNAEEGMEMEEFPNNDSHCSFHSLDCNFGDCHCNFHYLDSCNKFHSSDCNSFPDSFAALVEAAAKHPEISKRAARMPLFSRICKRMQLRLVE